MQRKLIGGLALAMFAMQACSTGAAGELAGTQTAVAAQVMTQTLSTAEGQVAPSPTSPTSTAGKCGDGIWDAAEQADPNLCPQDRPTEAPGTQPTAPAATESAATSGDLIFAPDPGLRIDNASNSSVGLDPASGVIYLYYLNRVANRQEVATAADGLNFGAGSVPDGYPFDAHNTRLPDGTWRRYLYDNRTGQMTSESSTDGVHFTPDAGVRYTPTERDNGTLGVYDFHVTSSGMVIMVYLGDLMGQNNLRRAVSTDNGWTFTFDRGDVLGDGALGGGPNSFVDPKLITLPDGRVRLLTMKMGAVYSFIADDNLETFTQEPGVRLAPGDFTEFKVQALFDPVIVRLLDGRYRIYATAGLADDPEHQALVSATNP